MLDSRVGAEKVNSIDDLDDSDKERILYINEQLGLTKKPTIEKDVFVGRFVDEENEDPEIYTINFSNYLMLGLSNGVLECALENKDMDGDMSRKMSKYFSSGSHTFTGYDRRIGEKGYWHDYYKLTEHTDNFLKSYTFYSGQYSELRDTEFEFSDNH